LPPAGAIDTLTASATSRGKLRSVTARMTRTGQQPSREVIAAVLTNLAILAASLASRDDEDGQGLAEYALILGLIAIVAIVTLVFLGNQVSSKLTTIGTTL
jgi:pilus assembly protein Flp/PilA